MIPAIYWPDVTALKHVHGKPFPFSARDIEGRSEGFLTHPKPNEHIPLLDPNGNRRPIPAVAGLRHFKAAVDAEYEDAARRRANNDYQCMYTAGQALELLGGVFEGMPAVFKDTIHHAHDDYAKLRAEVAMLGGKVTVEIDPSNARAFAG